MSRRLKPVEPLAESGADVRQLEHEPRNPNGFTFGQGDRVWLNAKSAAAYLDCPNVRAFYKTVSRYGITKGRRGRSLMFDRRELDAFVRGRRKVS